MKDLLIGLALLSCPAIVFAVFGNSGREAFSEGAMHAAAYSAAEVGQIAFAADCAACHGRNAEGTERGPALTQAAYGPAELPDQHFRDAVQKGAPARRHDFGAMPAFPGLPDRRLDQILAFVRELQRARGIR